MEKFEEEQHRESLEEIIERNLLMMGDPLDQLRSSESLGGNAGSVVIDGKKYSCCGLNGYADKDSGEIIAFGNSQDVPREIIDRHRPFTFREAYNLSGIIRGDHQGKRLKIISVFGVDSFSEKAKSVLGESVRRYNEANWIE